MAYRCTSNIIIMAAVNKRKIDFMLFKTITSDNIIMNDTKKRMKSDAGFIL